MKGKIYERGITLIALVITIIVLLILAGVTLSIVFNGGIIDKSQNAVDKYSYESQNETEILEYMEKQFSQISGIKDNTKGTTNTKVLEDKAYSYNNPVIPAGFKTSNEGASWTVRNDEVSGWNDGLVIEDSQGNQFVWVPAQIKGKGISGVVEYEKWCTKNIAYNHTDIDDDTLPSGNDGNEIDENDQIKIYGGFYIARYEAGIPASMTNAINIDDTLSYDELIAELIEVRNVPVATGVAPVSKKNQVPWNYIDYTKSKANAESMYTNNNVKSGLVTGTQWDTVMKWLENAKVDVEKDSREWGNYYNAPVSGITWCSTNEGASWRQIDSTTKGTNAYWLLKTGNTNYTSRKNIYDLAGNVWEWTSELYSSNRVRRGGSIYHDCTSGAAACRYDSSEYSTGKSLGFRCVLYVMDKI